MQAISAIECPHCHHQSLLQINTNQLHCLNCNASITVPASIPSPQPKKAEPVSVVRWLVLLIVIGVSLSVGEMLQLRTTWIEWQRQFEQWNNRDTYQESVNQKALTLQQQRDRLQVVSPTLPIVSESNIANTTLN